MNTQPHPLITQPGGHSAKNARQAGAPNTQPSGENPMVGTVPTVDASTVTEIQERLYQCAERFVQADHASGAVRVYFRPLAALVAEIVADWTRAERAARAALWELLKQQTRTVIDQRQEHAAECDAHNDIVCDLLAELEKAERGWGGAA